MNETSRHPRRRSLLAASLALPLATALAPLHAQTGAWPNKAVRVIIPGSAGSGPDTLARILTA